MIVNAPGERELGGSYSEFLGAMQYRSGKTQQELADYTGIKLSSLGRHIRGDVIPQRRARLAIQETFGLTSDETAQLYRLSLDGRKEKRSSNSEIESDPQLQPGDTEVASLAAETLETVLDTMERRPLEPVEGLLGITALHVLRDLTPGSS
jgi:transcriptional regulator with XRE-family HTH domain